MRRRVNWKRIGIVIGVALFIFLAAGVYMAGLNEHPLPPATAPMMLQNGKVTGNRVTTKSWSIAYRQAEVSPDGSSAMIDGVHDGVFYHKGKPALKLEAEHMTLNRATLDFTATGRVHVERLGADKDQTFDTDLVVWSNSAKLLTLSHPSYFRTSGQTLKVNDVTMDLTKNEVNIGTIEGAVNIPK